MAHLAFLIGAGINVGIVDPFTPQRMTAARLHPRRDPEEHPQGGGDPADDPQDDPKDDPQDEEPKDPPKADDDKTDWKAMARKHEQRAKDNAEAAKELAKLKKSQMSEAEKLQTERDEAKAEAEATKAENARLKVEKKFKNLTDDDFAILDGVPADQYEARAKALSDRIAKAAPDAPAGPSGTEVKGAKQKAPLEQQLADAQKAKDWPRVIALKQQLYSK